MTLFWILACKTWVGVPLRVANTITVGSTTVRAHQDHYDAEGPTFPSFPLLCACQTQQCVHTRITMMLRGPLSPIVCSSNTTVRAHQDHYDAEGPTFPSFPLLYASQTQQCMHTRITIMPRGPLSPPFPYCVPVKHNSACTPGSL